MQREFSPKLSAHFSEISSNKALFRRVAELWDKRDDLGLTDEQARVLMLTHRGFVRSGAALSEAFEAQGAVIPGMYTASLMAGEKSGGLEEVIRRYVVHVKVIANVKRKTVSALVYPVILLCLSLVVVSIIVLRVVPQFEGFYQGFGEELPVITQLIVSMSAFFRAYFVLLVLAIGGAIAAGWYWVRQPGQLAVLDRLILRVPGIGRIAGRFATSQLARTLATLLSGGIPLVNAIDVDDLVFVEQFEHG